jgi:hypothetical protein
MSELKSPVHMFLYFAMSSLIANASFLSFPFASVAKDVYGAETRYENCAQLQRNLNRKNNPYVEYKGFEKARLMKRTHADFAYMVYCNGGIVVNNEGKTICRGYIGYAYFPKMGIASYYGDWGQTDGASNDGDTDSDRYCRRLK